MEHAHMLESGISVKREQDLSTSAATFLVSDLKVHAWGRFHPKPRGLQESWGFFFQNSALPAKIDENWGFCFPVFEGNKKPGWSDLENEAWATEPFWGLRIC